VENIKPENLFLALAMHTKKTVVFMAGGLGSRYKGLKQVDGILPNGSPLIEYSLYDAIESGFTKFVFIISRAVPENFIAKISAVLNNKRLEHHWVVQTTESFLPADHSLSPREKPWGTGHALLCAQKVVQENFLVINADDFYGRTSFQCAAAMIHKGNVGEHQYSTIAFLLENTLSENGPVSRGVCATDDNGKLMSVREFTNICKKENDIIASGGNREVVLQPDDIVSMNFWVLNPSVFRFLSEDFELFLKSQPGPKEEFFLPSVIDQKIREKAICVTVEVSEESWKGITYPEDKQELQKFLTQKIKDGVYPENLWT